MPTEATQVAAWGPRSPLLATRACTSSCRGLLGRSREHQLPRTPARGPRASCRPFLSSPPHQKLEIMRPTRTYSFARVCSTRKDANDLSGVAFACAAGVGSREQRDGASGLAESSWLCSS